MSRFDPPQGDIGSNANLKLYKAYYVNSYHDFSLMSSSNCKDEQQCLKRPCQWKLLGEYVLSICLDKGELNFEEREGFL